MSLDIDIIIFIAFVGLKSGKKVKTIQDYALGGRNFSTGALVSTIVATCVTGSGFFIILTKTYSDGFYYLIPTVFIIIQMFITVYFLIPRMGEFLGNVSVAEAMGDIYVKEIRLITAICGILKMVGGIAVQFKVFGNIFNYFLGMDSTYAILLASAIVVVYSSFGGIRAVTYTDVIQFITFGFVVPLIGVVLWNHIYNNNIAFSEIIENSNFDYKKVLDIGNPKLWDMIPLILYFIMPSTDPTSFQRISMGRNIYQARKAWFIAAIWFGNSFHMLDSIFAYTSRTRTAT
jgi:Na+/proline symporter